MHTGGCVCNRLGPKALLLLGQSGGIVTTDVYRKFCPPSQDPLCAHCWQERRTDVTHHSCAHKSI